MKQKLTVHVYSGGKSRLTLVFKFMNHARLLVTQKPFASLKQAPIYIRMGGCCQRRNLPNEILPMHFKLNDPFKHLFMIPKGQCSTATHDLAWHEFHLGLNWKRTLPNTSGFPISKSRPKLDNFPALLTVIFFYIRCFERLRVEVSLQYYVVCSYDRPSVDGCERQASNTFVGYCSIYSNGEELQIY